MSIRKVVIESPYNAPTDVGVLENIKYADRCMLDSLERGEAPFLGHLLYTRVWNDREAPLRAKGIAAHCAWIEAADAVIFYVDRGMTDGMLKARAKALELGKEMEIRKLDP